MLNYAGGNPITAYNLTRSLRFRASASAYLSRIPSVSGNRKTYTLSMWVKRSIIGSGTGQTILCATDNTTTSTLIYFNPFAGGATDCLTYRDGTNSVTATQVFRDPSSWYHIVIAVDTTQATASNRVRMYVNGGEITSFSSTAYPAQNTDTSFNRNWFHSIGDYWTAGGYYFDGYLSEFNWIDGLQLTPSSFGSYNSTTGVWQPAKYTGTYGTNGFYLPFTDNSALTTSSNVGLGKDFSGNGNYWVTNNISITSGVTYDSMTDVPTLTSATAANFAVCNNLINASNTFYSNANLTARTGTPDTYGTIATIGITSGKFYWEVTIGSGGSSTVEAMLGIRNASSIADYPGKDANGYGYYGFNGNKFNNGSGSAYGASYTLNDVIGVAFDATSGTLTFYKNNVSQGTAFSSIPSNTWFPAFGDGSTVNTVEMNINFGQRPFTYTPPSGFVALNTFNLPDSTIKQGNKYMDATLYTGNGSAQTITNAAGFKPDFIWQKARNEVASHRLVDSIRGANQVIYSNLTNAETFESGVVNTFNSNGFTGGSGNVVSSGNLAVAWQWQAGQGSTSTNTSGTITSTVSVNASAGFSIVTYTGTGANATVGHGLGVAPQFIIVKNRSQVSAWIAGHQYMASANPWNGYMVLNSTAAQTSSGGSLIWNNTAPTSSVFSVGTDTATNFSGNSLVAYCFAPIAGYSAFGSISANGSTDNYFAYTGFLPRFVMLKRTDSTSNWIIWDTARNTYNVLGNELYPNLSNAEASAVDLDIVSNGFKLRNSGFSGTWIYAAFATTPFKNSLAF